MGKRIAGIVLVLMGISLWSISSVCAEEDPLMKPTPEEVLETADFYLRLRPNYARSYWIVRQDDDDLVGIAPYDSAKRRWTLMSLRGEYYGFIQALIGDEVNQWFTQLLWYGKENEYKGFFVARLGGRPVTPDLPFGELGGEMLLYPMGNLPMEQPHYEIEVDPLRRFPEGVEVTPIKPPSQE